MHETLDLLAAPGSNIVVNMLGLEVAERPAFFAELLPQVAAMRARTGRPHWMVVDEAHHMLPAASAPAAVALPKTMPATIYVTVHPDQMSTEALAGVDTVLAIGDAAEEVITASARRSASIRPRRRSALPGGARCCSGTAPRARRAWCSPTGPASSSSGTRANMPRASSARTKASTSVARRRAEPTRPEPIGVPADGRGRRRRTWLHHLKRGDYSRWFREAIKDDDLAEEAEQAERADAESASVSRAIIREAVTSRYTAPARE